MSKFFNIGKTKIASKNPKVYICKRSDIILKDNEPVLKKIRFTCDNCSAPMIIKDGKYGPFLACPNWKKDKKCAENTIKIIVKEG